MYNLNIASLVNEIAMYRMLNELGVEGVPNMYGHAIIGKYGVIVMTLLDYDLTSFVKSAIYLTYTLEDKMDLCNKFISVLHRINSQYVAHLDVKPANLGVIVDPSNNEVKVFVFDFGLSVLTGGKSDRCRGCTLEYASPEQISNHFSSTANGKFYMR